MGAAHEWCVMMRQVSQYGRGGAGVFADLIREEVGCRWRDEHFSANDQPIP